MKGVKQPLLIDGGVYDNQGVHNLMERGNRYLFTKYCIVSNAGVTSLSDFKHLRNILQMMAAMSEVLMKRIRDMMSRQLKIETDDRDNRGVYVDLLSDPSDTLVETFVKDLACGLVPEVTWRIHGIAEDDVRALRDYFRAYFKLEPVVSKRVTERVKNNISWNTLEHMRPTQEEIKVARGVGSNLTGLSKKKIYCLEKFAEWMTFVQVRLYLPNLTEK